LKSIKVSLIKQLVKAKQKITTLCLLFSTLSELTVNEW